MNHQFNAIAMLQLTKKYDANYPMPQSLPILDLTTIPSIINWILLNGKPVR
jgi:hypothetical protein